MQVQFLSNICSICCPFFTGSYDVGPQGKLRTFLSYLHCRAALDLGTGKTYLIMGTSKDIYRDEQSQL